MEAKVGMMWPQATECQHTKVDPVDSQSEIQPWVQEGARGAEGGMQGGQEWEMSL